MDWSGAGEGSMGSSGGKKSGKGSKERESGKAVGGKTAGGSGKTASGGGKTVGPKAKLGAASPHAAVTAGAPGPRDSGRTAGSGTAADAAPDMFVVAAGAPAIERHRPRLDDAGLQAVFVRKRALREQRIAEIVARAEQEGRPSERIVAAIIYDSEQAPYTTNRRQLAEIGVECPKPGLVDLPEPEVHETLWRVVYGLAYLGIFLNGTDHLDDRGLLRILCTRILEEQVRDVPPSRDMSEFIDLTPCRAADLDGPDGPDGPDGLEGPFDVATEDPGEDDDDPTGFGVKRRTHRDDLLPRPSRGPM